RRRPGEHRARASGRAGQANTPPYPPNAFFGTPPSPVRSRNRRASSSAVGCPRRSFVTSDGLTWDSTSRRDHVSGGGMGWNGVSPEILQYFAMARPPRLEFPGGVYHVVVRGNER